MNREELRRMAAMDINEIDPATLVDISTVEIDPDLPYKERVKQYVEQIKNPYCYIHQGVVVKISFADTDRTLEDCMRDYIRAELELAVEA